MKRISSAYKFGKEGKPAPENISAAQRIANRLGQRGVAKTVGINNELSKQMQERLHEAISSSVDLNKQALELIELMAKIPNQSSSNPGWGHERTDIDGKHSYEWVVALSSGLDQDSSRPFKTPLIESLGSLHIDSADWSHNGFVLPVDNVFLVCTAPIDDVGNVQPASTRLDINTRPYDPDTTILDNEAEFKGGVKIALSPDGHITELGMTRSSSTGYVPEDPTRIKIDLGAFFDNAQRATAATVSTYQSMPGSPN